MTLLIFLVCGVALGRLLRGRARWLRRARRLSGAVVYLLLFLLGLSVGGSPAVMSAPRLIGLEALALSVGAVTGSVLLVLTVARQLRMDDA